MIDESAAALQLKKMRTELEKFFGSRDKVEQRLDNQLWREHPRATPIFKRGPNTDPLNLRLVIDIVTLLEPNQLNINPLAIILKVLKFAIDQLPDKTLGKAGMTNVTYRQLARGSYIDYNDTKFNFNEDVRRKLEDERNVEIKHKDQYILFLVFDEADHYQPNKSSRETWTGKMREELAKVLVRIESNPQLQLTYWITRSDEHVLLLIGDSSRSNVGRAALAAVAKASANNVIELEATTSERLLSTVNGYLSTDTREDLTQALNMLQRRIGSNLYLLIDNAAGWNIIEAPVMRSRRCIVTADEDFIPDPHPVIVISPPTPPSADPPSPEAAEAIDASEAAHAEADLPTAGPHPSEAHSSTDTDTESPQAVAEPEFSHKPPLPQPVVSQPEPDAEPPEAPPDPHIRRQRTKDTIFGSIGFVGVAIMLLSNLLPASGDNSLSNGTLAVGVAVLVAAILAYGLLSDKRVDMLPPGHMAKMLAALADAVAKEWEDEEEARKVDDPRPLPVQWRNADSVSVDNWTRGDCVPNGTPLGQVQLDGQFDTIADTYERVPSKRLVVLGDAGAGKTILVTRLALKLLAMRQPNDPVPVLFSAATWDTKKQSLHKWLEVQLLIGERGLNALIAPRTTIARRMIEKGLILPIIDGFDEMGDTFCIQALAILNAENTETEPIVLTSHADKYQEALKSPRGLHCAAVVQLEPLLQNDVITYLQDSAEGGATIWDDVLEKVERDAAAAARFNEVFETPLMVFLARVTYGKQAKCNPAELLDFEQFRTSEDARRHLLRSFPEAAYQGSVYQVADARRWLAFLGSHLAGRNIIWWKLPRAVPWYWRAFVFGIIAGLFGAVFGGAVYATGRGDAIAVVVAGLIGLVAGAGFPLWSPPAPPRVELKFSSLRTRWKKLTCPAGAFVAVVSSWHFIISTGSWWPLVPGAVFGAMVVSSIEAGRNWGTPDWQRPFDQMRIDVPAWFIGAVTIVATGMLTHAPVGIFGVWMALSLVWGLLMDLAYMPAVPLQVGAATGLVTTLGTTRWFVFYLAGITTIAYGLILSFLLGPYAGAIAGLIVGIVFAVASQGRGQWLVLCRGWLPLTGKLPWSVDAFIEDAHDRQVLRQSGAAYQFRHDLLREEIVGGSSVD